MFRRNSRVAVATAAALATLAPASTALASPTPVDTALEWYDTTAATLSTGSRPQVTNSRAWAIGWLAAARALRQAPPSRAYQDAALASAVHATLSALVPDQAAPLDTALAATLARIPDGAAENRGVAAGRGEAERLIAARDGDGLDPASVNAPYTPPPPGPGVWRPTPPAFAAATQAGNRYAKPFLLRGADQFRPGPPPAPDSPRARADLAEVRAYGAFDSAVRTAAQTDTATFWYGSSLTLYNGILRAALVQSRQSIAWRAGLVAIFHTALVDTQIATSDTKYAYVLWRPVTAIQTTDPTWTPLHVTPAHPDYPSGHNTYSGAAEQVLTALVGPRARPYTITSPSQPGATRTYTGWHQPTLENVDARVWSGIHTRTADEVGVALGRQVAAHTLREAWHLFA
jgi:hypothetical protein